jgi:hypothetical protein
VKKNCEQVVSAVQLHPALGQRGLRCRVKILLGITIFGNISQIGTILALSLIPKMTRDICYFSSFQKPA